MWVYGLRTSGNRILSVQLYCLSNPRIYTLDCGIVMESWTKTKTQRSQAINCNISRTSQQEAFRRTRKLQGPTLQPPRSGQGWPSSNQNGCRAYRSDRLRYMYIGQDRCPMSICLKRCFDAAAGGWAVGVGKSMTMIHPSSILKESIWPWIFLSFLHHRSGSETISTRSGRLSMARANWRLRLED